MFAVENSVVKSLAYGQVRVLAMKLQLPLVPMHGIKRLDRIRDFSQYMESASIAYLLAAPGYGKSCFLAQFLNSRRQQSETVAWLTLDPKENDRRRFLTYLIAACNHGDNTLAVNSLKALDDKQPLDEVFNSLLHELALYEKPLNLALDDVHHLNNEGVLSDLQSLLDYLPENVKVFITARQKISLDMARYHAQQVLIQFNESELALDAAECRELINKKLDKELDIKSHHQVYELSQGWFDGLNILIQHYQQHQSFDMDGQEALLVEYFDETFLSPLTGEKLKCAVRAAILGRTDKHYIKGVFEGEMLAEDTSFSEDYEQTLDYLVAQHLFFVRDERAYDFVLPHPLLRLYLTRNQLNTYLKQVYHAASLWLHSQEMVIQSVEMALKSGDKKLAAQFLQVMAEDILEEQDLAKLLSWKQQLPDEVICESPRLIVIFSWALALALQLDDAERLMSRMDVAIGDKKHLLTDEISGQLFAIRAYVARNRGNLINAEQLCHEAISKLSHDTYMARALTFMNLSNISMTRDKLSDARRYNRLAFESARSVGSIHLEMLATHELARIEQTKGNLYLSLKLIDEGLLLADRLEHKEKVAGYGRLLIYKGYITWLQNKVEEAQGYLKEGIQVAMVCHDAYFSMGTILLSNIARQSNDTETAYDHLSSVEAQLQRWSIPNFVYHPWLSAMRCNLLIDQGRVDEAQIKLRELSYLLQQNPFALSPEHYPGLRGIVEVFFVRAKAIAGHHKEALRLLDEKLPNSINNQQGFALTFVYLMRAILRFQLGKEDEAVQDFKRAVGFAQNDLCLMPFIEYSSGMSALYGRLPPSLKQSQFVRTILDNIELGDEDIHNQAFAQAKSVISQRELAVLELIAEGLSNQAIAERLFISLHTVKTHTRKINAKLGVKNRTQALIRAKEIGLVA